MTSRGTVTPFRVADARAGASDPGADLAEELQRRLRQLQWLSIVTLAALLGIALFANWTLFVSDLWRWLVTPPVPAIQLANVVITVALLVGLEPRRRWRLRDLRLVEGWIIGLSLLFWIQNVTTDLHAIIANASLTTAPQNNALAHAARFGAPMLGVSIILPATRRYAIGRVAVMLAAAAMPPILVFAGRSAVPNQSVYLVTYAASMLLFTLMAMYGGYRIAVYRDDASELRRLGQYVLRERLGAGGMGEVYRAEHRFLRRPCAAKLIRPEQAGDAATLARFEREVQATATLTHPSTVQVYDYGRAEDGTFYYVMEYLDGQPLDALVEREGALAPARAAGILQQLCGALAEAHERGMLHRDIKPGNVIVGTRGRIPDVAKLLDFGLVAPLRVGANGGDAPEATRLTQAGMIVGTPEYMSPEQCAGDAPVGVESDIYALGALAYFLLAGRSPFAGRGIVQMLAAHLHERPVPLHEVRGDVPPALSAAIARALEKGAGDRYASADAFSTALGEAIEAKVALR